MKKLTRKTWRKYAGCVIRGKEPVPVVSDSSWHLDRAAWLTSMVESGGFYGTVQNFDGAGITASVHQAIAVYPKELLHDDEIAEDDQGPLWELLLRMSNMVYLSAHHSFTVEWIEFAEALLDAGWYISPDGVLCDNDTGRVINGYEIREEFTGSKTGYMPIKGEERECAEAWLRRFHKLFSNPATFQVQQQFGKEHICKGAKRKLRFATISRARTQTIQDEFYQGRDLSRLKIHPDGTAMDLAMCMFWNYNVNAPGQALKCISQVVDKWWGLDVNYTQLATDLINKLGNSSYGKWDDDLKNGRYQRTRRAAMQVWPKGLFIKGAVMPKDLEG